MAERSDHGTGIDAAPFPPGFLFGAATAAYQIEGAATEAGRGPSIWDTYSHTPGRVLDGDTGDVADDHYHRMEEDLDLMVRLGLQSYRFSLAWPRIQPTGRGAANPAGLAFYDRLVDGLRSRGIEPIATLYHWDLPQRLQDEGGWENRGTAEAFAAYAAIVGAHLGDRITHWSTLNEPWCSAYLGYGTGTHAPGIADREASLRAVHHLNLAHGLAVRELRRTAGPDAIVSIVLNLQVVRPHGDLGDEAVRRIDGLANRVFLGPLLEGAYPADVLADTADITDWAFVRPGDLEITGTPIDVLGVNYYFSETVAMWDGMRPRAGGDRHDHGVGTAWPGSEQVDFLPRTEPTTAMGWNIDPDGLEQLLLRLSRSYPGLPLMIMENGAAFEDEVRVIDGTRRIPDAHRIDYLRRHVEVVQRMLAQDVPLIGYQLWSLLDNFEWAYGYSKRFGIVRVDYDTLERTPKDSAHWYAELIRTRRIPAG